MAISKVRIHNDLWKVEMVSADSTAMNSPEVTVLGKTDYTSLTISLREKMPETVLMATVVHELCHAYSLSYGGSITDEESACEFFGAHGVEIIAASAMVMSDLLPDEDITELFSDDELEFDLDKDDEDASIGDDIEDDGK